MENVHSVMATPNFDPWTVETYFTPEGQMISRDLYRTAIRLRKGSMEAFIEQFRRITKDGQPYLLDFYSPAGQLLQAEVRRLELPEVQAKEYDSINALVYLTPDQVLAISPDDALTEFCY